MYDVARRWLAVLVVLLGVAVTACGSSGDSGAPVSGISVQDDDGYRGIFLDEPYDVPSVELTDTGGGPSTSRTRTAGRWSSSATPTAPTSVRS